MHNNNGFNAMLTTGNPAMYGKDETWDAQMAAAFTHGKLANNADQYSVHRESDGCTVAVTHDDVDGELARLFAAAPEMLEVLERCADFMGSVANGGRGPSKVSETFRQAYKDARRVISKAKSE